MARRTGNHGKSSASEFDETEGFSFHVPDLRERQYYRERSVDIPERGPVCTNNTPQNERNYSDEMQRRFEKARKDEEKLLSSTSRNDVFDDDDDDVLAMKPLTVLIGGDSKKAKKDEENEDDRFEMNGDFLKQIQKKRRRHRRRRSGSFTGGVWPRKGHRNRSLLGYAIPPPNVHSTDWRDMLAITDSKDAKLAARLGAVSSIRKATETAEGASTSGGGAPAAANVISPAMTSSSGQFAGSSASVPALFSQYRFSTSNMSLNRANWILETFTRRECARFIPTHRDERKCGCGRLNAAHLDLPELTSQYLNQKKSLAMIERSRSVAESEADKENIKAISDCVERRQNKGPNHHHRWSMRKHTVCVPTDAFGQIEFQGGPHPYKAQYVRMNFDTEPAYIMSLFEHVWQIAPPRLIITVHGGTGDFDLQPKLARVFRKGLLKAATTTGAWIITSGCNTGVVRHVAAALEVAGSAQRNKIVCIGIAPWGMLKKREELKGEDVTVPYYPVSAKGRFTGLNNRHSYFLLVDNGTVGRYGAEVILRKRLETYISQKQKIFGSTRSVPVVCVVLEGGSCTIRSVLDYVTNVPRVPVVVCDGSGRAADLLAFAHQTVEEDGSLPEGVRPQLHTLVERVFGCTGSSADRVLHELIICAQQKNLLTIFRLGEKGEHDVDHAILTALLKGQNLSPADQLALALAWNRVDIARSDIFAMGHEWPQAALHNAMMEALIHDRVDFVRLLLENGVNMQRFLSISRLEELYNTDKGPPNTLYYIVRDVVKVKSGYRYRLPHIGMVIEKLMGNAYRSLYTSNEFREKYQTIMKKFKAQHKQMRMMNQNRMATGSVPMSRQSTEPAFFGNFGNQDTISEPVGISVSALSGSRALSNHILWRSAFRRDYPINQSSMRPPNLNDSRDANSEVEDERSTMDGSEISHNEYQFRYPYSELLLWAVLTKRQEMALCMWQHGEEALAKALVACRLYKSLATEAAEDYLEVEICDELKKYAEEFRVLSLELLDHCYHHDDAQTLQLLTYELSNWSDETCLALAVMVNNKNFLAHPCCQILLADLWHGGLRIRSHSNVKVVGGLVMPLSILMLEFKTREELLNQPQTAAEHEQDLNDSSSSSGNSSSSSEDSSSSSFEDDYDDELTPGETVKDRRSRKQSHGSVSSLNLPPTHIGSLFASSRHRKKRKTDRDTDASANEAGRIGANGGNEYGTFRVNSVSPDRPIQLRHRTRHSSYLAGKSDDTKVSSVYGSNSVIANAKSPVTSLINSKAFPINSILPGFQRTRPIKVRRRFYEFYAAPITTFWAWALSFVCFIIGLTFVLLVRTPPKPSWLEWTLFAYVVSFGMEHMRKMFMSDMKPFVEKLKFFFFNWWNSVTMVAVLLFIIGFVIRVFGDVSSGRVVLACDSVLWTMKLLDYMSVHPRLGPYITMAGKMIMSMSYIIVMLVVALLSFGLARQSITFPNENWHWILVRNIFLKPYFMLYGEVYADEIDTCGDEAWDQHLENGGPVMMGNATTGLNCVPGYWIPPVLMTFFLLIANILLMSMLIAIFNHIFDQTDEIAQQIWLFQRYRQVMEYESTPFLPPPFTPLYHAYMLIKLVHWRLTKNKDSKDLDEKRDLFDFSLKLFLNDDQVEKLHDFEEDCMEDLARQKELEKNTSSEQRILRTDQRTDQILNRMVDLQTKETMAREAINDIDGRLGALEKNQTEILEYLRTLVAFNAAQQTSLQPTFQQARHSPTPDQNTQHLRLPENQSTIAGALSEERLNAPMSVRRVRTSTICAMSSEEPTLLSPRSAGATAASAAVTDAVRLASVASMDQLPMSVMSKLSTVSTRRNQRHEEYTSITDSIAVCVFDRRLKTRSHSSEQDSVPQSEIDEEKTMSPRKRSMIALPHHPELDEADNSTFEEEISRLARDEEGHADCELTDVDLEDDEEEEEEDQINASELVSDADDDVVEGRPHAQTLASIASKMSLQVVDETGDGHHPSPQIFSPSADASPQLVHRRRSRSP